ncbi:protein-L-isoaspartate O-methyltransferase [Nanoarchaeota archaeon]
MEIVALIEKEKDYEKKKLLYSVYLNNKSFAASKIQKDLLKGIIQAMSVIDRKFFILEGDEDEAYVDQPISIGYKQTISQPSTVAKMLLLAELKKGQDVLEVGSGSGWAAALISYLIFPGKLVSIERLAPLSEFARKNVNNLPDKVKSKMNYEFLFGNGLNPKHTIWKTGYDRVVVAAAGSEDLIKNLKKIANLKDNGLILFPTSIGNLELWESKKGKLQVEHVEEGYAFVPLVEE